MQNSNKSYPYCTLWDFVRGWHWHTDIASWYRNGRVKFQKGMNRRLKHSHMSYALLWYFPVAKTVRLCIRLTQTHCHCFIEQIWQRKYFKRAWNGRLKHSHMSYALKCYIPVAPCTRPCLRQTLTHSHWFMEQKVQTKNFKRIWNGNLKDSHMSNGLWCYITVAASLRLCLKPTLTHSHYFMEQKLHRRNFIRVWNGNL